jgi:two-component system OmpR family sensor kinase
VVIAAVPGAETLELHVTDSGDGFPPAFVEHAFERFTRADRGRTEHGAGLGLAIVAVVAEAHGGEAHAVNRPSGGADVWLSLPRGDGSAGEAPAPPATGASA